MKTDKYQVKDPNLSEWLEDLQHIFENLITIFSLIIQINFSYKNLNILDIPKKY